MSGAIRSRLVAPRRLEANTAYTALVVPAFQRINKLNGQFNERDLLLLRILAGMGALAEATDTWLCEPDLAR